MLDGSDLQALAIEIVSTDYQRTAGLFRRSCQTVDEIVGTLTLFGDSGPGIRCLHVLVKVQDLSPVLLVGSISGSCHLPRVHYQVRILDTQTYDSLLVLGLPQLQKTSRLLTFHPHG